MGRIFGIGHFKPANAFPMLAETFKVKSPVKKLDRFSTAKSRIKNDTFTKTTAPAKKAHKPHGR